MREQREQAGRMPPKVYTAYDDEMPVSERRRNYCSESAMPSLSVAFQTRVSLTHELIRPLAVTCREWAVRGTCFFFRRRVHLVRDRLLALSSRRAITTPQRPFYHRQPARHPRRLVDWGRSTPRRARRTPSSAVRSCHRCDDCELMKLVTRYQSPARICRRWQAGHCPDGDDECRYLHSNDPRDRQQPRAQKPPPSSATLAPQADASDEEKLSPRDLKERAKMPCKWHASSSGFEYGQDCHFKHTGQHPPITEVDELNEANRYKERLRSKF